MVKKLLVALVLGFTALPFQAAHALTWAAEPTEEVIDNMLSAESVDFTVDLDVTMDNDHIDQPVAMHVNVGGVSDLERNSAFDIHFWSTDEDGAFQEAEGSVVVTEDAVYFSAGDDEWFFVELDASNADEGADAERTTEEYTAFLQELLNEGVVEYRAEALAIVNRTVTLRYAYEVNNDRLVDYLVAKGVVPEDEAQDAKDTLGDVVTIGGSFWVDTVAMLPVMFTLNVNAQPSATSYTNVELSVLFNSFNGPVDIDVPTDAKSIEEYANDASGEVVMASIAATVSAIDTDGDGLTDEDEHTVWESNPLSDDTDSDGYPDATEVVNGYDPNGVGKLDADGDGLTDYSEMTVYETDRYDADSDNDGYNDGLEVMNGYNPNGPGRA